MTIKNDYSKTRNKPVDAFIYGKVPPQSTEMEVAVLGAILLERDRLEDVLGIIQKPECFYKDAHVSIYRAIMELNSRQQPVDSLTIVNALAARGINELEGEQPAYYLAKLTMEVVSSAHVEYHAQVIVEKYMLREMIRIGGRIVNDGYNESAVPSELINSAERSIFELSTGSVQADYKPASFYAKAGLKEVEERQSASVKYSGIPTGYDALNRLTYGWQPTDLIIIAARPSVGKTAFALQLAMNAAESSYPVGFFSLEMSPIKLTHRAFSCLSQVSLDKISRGTMNPEEQKKVYAAAERFSKMPIVFDETPGINIYQLRTKARRMVKREKVKILFIDYLQLMQGIEESKISNREQEVSKISRDLKALAKELNIPIVALAQLNRSVETRGQNRSPILSDLRESGAIEQDADIVGFLYRSSYQKEEKEIDPKVAYDSTFKIAKHRNGKTDTLAFKTLMDIQTWFDLKGFDSYNSEQISLALNMPVAGNNNSQPMQDDDLPF